MTSNYIIDTHTHLDDSRYDGILDEVLNQAKLAGVIKYIIPGADLKSLKKASEIAKKYEGVYFAAGVHPYDIDGFDEEYLKNFLNDEKCLAIGECGLDYNKNPSLDEKIQQERIFRRQIELACSNNMPLIVHIRDASEAALKILKEYKDAYGVLHCFNASPILLELEDKFYYGIGGVLTFKNAKNLINILGKIRKDRILIETDAPYLTPHPYRGSLNEPKYCALVVEKISELLGLSIDEVKYLTTINAKKLFKGLV